jgi:hypothetical protein
MRTRLNRGISLTVRVERACSYLQHDVKHHYTDAKMPVVTAHERYARFLEGLPHMRHIWRQSVAMKDKEKDALSSGTVIRYTIPNHIGLLKLITCAKPQHGVYRPVFEHQLHDDMSLLDRCKQWMRAHVLSPVSCVSPTTYGFLRNVLRMSLHLTAPAYVYVPT